VKNCYCSFIRNSFPEFLGPGARQGASIGSQGRFRERGLLLSIEIPKFNAMPQFFDGFLPSFSFDPGTDA